MLLCYAAQLAGTGLLLCTELHTSVLARRLVVCSPLASSHWQAGIFTENLNWRSRKEIGGEVTRLKLKGPKVDSGDSWRREASPLSTYQPWSLVECCEHLLQGSGRSPPANKWLSYILSPPLVGRQEGHPASKKLDVGLLVVMIWLELCATYSSSSPVVTTHHLHHPLLQ